MRIERYHRFWAVYEASGEMLCLCVYKKGALAVVKRLTATLPEGSRTVSLPSQARTRTRPAKAVYEANAS